MMTSYAELNIIHLPDSSRKGNSLIDTDSLAMLEGPAISLAATVNASILWRNVSSSHSSGNRFQ